MMKFASQVENLTPKYRQSVVRTSLSLTILVVGALGCQRSAPKDAPPPTSGTTPALRCEPIDCAELRDDETCELSSPSLTVWCAEMPANASVTVSPEPSTARADVVEKTRAAGGLRLRLEITVATDALWFAWGQRRQRIRVRTILLDPRVTEAVRLRREGRIEDAAEALLATRADETEEDRVRVRSWLARLQLSKGNVDQAIHELRSVIADAESQHMRSTAAWNRLALADTLRRHRGELAKARQVLESMARVPPNRAAEAAHQQGLIAEFSGNIRAARQHFNHALGLARRYDQSSLRSAIEHSLARLNATLGLATQTPEEGDAKEPCHAAQKQSDRAWLSILRASAGHETISDLAPFHNAVAPFRSACPSTWSLKNALINLAIAAERRGDMDAVAKAVAEAEAVEQTSPILDGWLIDLNGRLLAHRGRHAEAARVYRRAVDSIAPSASFETRYRLHLGFARALRATGDTDQAERHYRLAMRALAREEQLAPIFAGQETLVLSRGDAEKELVDLLLTQHRNADALLQIRRGRTRHLRALATRQRLALLPQEDRERFETQIGTVHRTRAALSEHHRGAWAVPIAERTAYARASTRLTQALEDALDQAFFVISDHASDEVGSPAAKGEALYTVYETGVGTYAFLQTQSETLVALIQPWHEPEASWLRDALATPFTEVLRRTSTLRVFQNAKMGEANVHTAPFLAQGEDEEQPLIEHMAVVYALDLPTQQRGAGSATPARPRALVVGNPTGDLPMADREVNQVQEKMSGRFAVSAREGDEATASALGNDLELVDWFHYAGHAVHDASHQLGSALKLADASEFTVADILSLKRAPTAVVLSSCEGARATGHGSMVGLGLAQAFVVAGSGSVIASTRPTPDAVALSLSQALYEKPPSSLTPENVRTVLRALRLKAPNDWQSFRLITR